MKRKRLSALALALTVLAGEGAWPCSCLEAPPVAQALAEADAVFRGEVESMRRSVWLAGLPIVALRSLWAGLTQGEDAMEAPMKAWVQTSGYERLARMRVREAFKGAPGSIAIVRTALDESGCGYDFSEDTDYLVYAYGVDDPVRPGHRLLLTSICSRTRRSAEAGDELAELRTLTRHVNRRRARAGP